MKLVDLSQTIEPNIVRFPAFPAPQISPFFSHEEAKRSGNYKDCSCEVTEVRMVTSLGTYLDAPYHFDPKGIDISQLPLERCVLNGVCVDVRPAAPRQGFDLETLDSIDCTGKAVLVCTGWSQFWGTDRYYQHPFLTQIAAERLFSKKVALVGIDTLVIDDTKDATRPVHTKLLQNGILIVENLTRLETIIGRSFTFCAVPAKVATAAAFPVRAYAMLNDGAGC